MTKKKQTTKQEIRLAVPYDDIAAFRDRMMSGGEFYADGGFLLYSKTKRVGGVLAEFRVEVENRRFYPQVRIERDCDILAKFQPVTPERALYGRYDFGEVVVNLVSFDSDEERAAGA